MLFKIGSETFLSGFLLWEVFKRFCYYHNVAANTPTPTMLPIEMIDDVDANGNQGDKAVVYLVEHRLVPETWSCRMKQLISWRRWKHDMWTEHNLSPSCSISLFSEVIRGFIWGGGSGGGDLGHMTFYEVTDTLFRFLITSNLISLICIWQGHMCHIRSTKCTDPFQEDVRPVEIHFGYFYIAWPHFHQFSESNSIQKPISSNFKLTWESCPEV